MVAQRTHSVCVYQFYDSLAWCACEIYASSMEVWKFSSVLITD